MYLLLGNTHMESGDYESAIDLFERAHAQVQHCQNQLPLVILLIILLDWSSTMCRNCSCSLLTDVEMEI